MDAYLAANRAHWDEAAPQHARSDFYDVKGFKAGRSTLRSVEREHLGDVRGKSLLHLQCHFGLDTLSWARLGARVTGVDFSAAAVDIARSLSGELEIPAEFVCAGIDDVAEALNREFDIVFTSYGVLVWLPDLAEWAEAIARCLRPGGVFCIVEHHPVLHTLDLEAPELRIESSYFHTRQPAAFAAGQTYAGACIAGVPTVYEWQHSLADVVTAVLDAGLTIRTLHEYPMCGWQASPLLERGADGWCRWKPGLPELPLLFSLTATKPV